MGGSKYNNQGETFPLVTTRNKIYANSKDHFSTKRPSDFREMTSPLHSCQNGLGAVCMQFRNKFREHHQPHRLLGPQCTQRLAGWDFPCSAHHFGIVSTEPGLRLWKLCIYEPTKSSIWKWFWIFGCFLTDTVKTFTVSQLQTSYSALIINTVEIIFFGKK